MILIPIWERIKDVVPAKLEHQGKKWKIIAENGLNDRLRFLRYEEGRTFLAHFDGGFTKSPR